MGALNRLLLQRPAVLRVFLPRASIFVIIPSRIGAFGWCGVLAAYLVAGYKKKKTRLT